MTQEGTQLVHASGPQFLLNCGPFFRHVAGAGASVFRALRLLMVAGSLLTSHRHYTSDALAQDCERNRLLTGQCLPILRCGCMGRCKCGSSCSSRTAIIRIDHNSAIGWARSEMSYHGSSDPWPRSWTPLSSSQPAATPRCTQRYRRLKANMNRLALAEEKGQENNTTHVSPPAISITSRLLG